MSGAVDNRNAEQRDAMLAATFGWSLSELRTIPEARRARMAQDIANQRALYEQLGFQMDAPGQPRD